MKQIIKNIAITGIAILGLTGCNDYLDRAPLSNVTPEVYFSTEDQLATYTISKYNFYTHGGWGAGTFLGDNGTDNQAGVNGNGIFLPGEWKVGANGGAWSFGYIRDMNYFFDKTLPKYEAGKITGNETWIKHYIGEAYFLRAKEYFGKLKTFGDFPIITKVLKDEKEELIEASKRRPRNEVARFILQDLDKAIELLQSSPVSNKNRISKEVAQLLKSEVALYEGTWLKNFKGTAFVPGGPGWPGANKDYLAGFSIDIDSEVNFFLSEAMESAEAVITAAPLVENNHKIGASGVFENPYYMMFSDTNMAGYSEVLLWRKYDEKYVGHKTMTYIMEGGATGYTKSYVESFLMKNGLPIYAPNSGYHGDDYIETVRKDRDERLQMFMKQPGDYLTTNTVVKARISNILDINERKSTTGYEIRKGLNPDEKHLKSTVDSDIGSLVYRSGEAYLNYIEAQYTKDNNLSSKSLQYWGAIRTRAGLPADPYITINATDLSKENDWAKYTAGSLVDKVMYNIRRERRSEFIAESKRMNDLKRWRSLEQLNNYQIEGFKLWGPMQEWYVDEEGKSRLVAMPEEDPNVSPKSASLYLRPYQIRESGNLFYNGLNWTMAHYLSPINLEHFLLTSPDGKAENSVIYQNPYWPTEANAAPTSN
ncbi:SusD family [Candidatus Ornithobacterium hominis]|uniref:RagB/SusD family nutrient uptake outer membrane protein n=1 Tax=Candidatus Ornithobacterium hominis TaxID=2497989 RepID=UPI0024BC3E4F|nr:RagB/SusD family nutrient uptake outer membrane protein [Candidatus Ornithobacterium hominis]CAI9430062.1 SusD family [Candidatus Ornithobacterium hominis]